MPLRSRPTLTPKSLAARRANALKSTGPRTARGKACASFNAFKHGRFAASSSLLRQRLLRAGYRNQEHLYGLIHSRIARTFGAGDPPAQRQADRLAASVWCLLVLRGPLGTKLESGLESGGKGPGILDRSMNSIGGDRRPAGHGTTEAPDSAGCEASAPDEVGALLQLLSQPVPVADRSRIQLHDGFHRLGLVFWVQARRRRTPGRRTKPAPALEPVARLGAETRYEGGLRSKVHRLRRPGMDDRLRYGLDRDGVHYPDRVRRGRRLLKQLGSWKLGPLWQCVDEAGV